jgi:hypothetical protein
VINQLRWEGFNDALFYFKGMPLSVRTGANAIASKHAHQAAALVVAAYPLGSAGRHNRRGQTLEPGNLKRGVRVVERPEVHPLGGMVVVQSGAPHAYIFERGTKVRTTKGHGYYRRPANRGQMPKGNVFIPIMIRERAAMETEIASYIRDQGLTVTEHAA